MTNRRLSWLRFVFCIVTAPTFAWANDVSSQAQVSTAVTAATETNDHTHHVAAGARHSEPGQSAPEFGTITVAFQDIPGDFGHLRIGINNGVETHWFDQRLSQAPGAPTYEPWPSSIDPAWRLQLRRGVPGEITWTFRFNPENKVLHEFRVPLAAAQRAMAEGQRLAGQNTYRLFHTDCTALCHRLLRFAGIEPPGTARTTRVFNRWAARASTRR